MDTIMMRLNNSITYLQPETREFEIGDFIYDIKLVKHRITGYRIIVNYAGIPIVHYYVECSRNKISPSDIYKDRASAIRAAYKKFEHELGITPEDIANL